MKRKAIQLANQTLVISMPSKWVKEQGIKKGDEIELEERGRELLINSKGIHNQEEKIEIDISGLNERTVRWYLSGLQKKGYDEIIVRYDKLNIVKTMEELVKDLFTGFIISEQSENKCVLKSISTVLESEFETSLRRAFLVTISMGESSLEMIKKGKLGNLNELISLEHTNNQLTNFCERILNKVGYSDYKKTCFIYVIVWNLEKICDEYKYICEFLSENNKLKISKEVIQLLEKTNKLLNSYYEIFYKFDIKKLNQLAEEKKEIEKEAIKIHKTKACKEMLIINHLLNIVSKIADFSTSMIILKI